MFVNQKMNTWSKPYWEHVIRNIGPITFEAQPEVSRRVFGRVRKRVDFRFR